MPNWCNNSIMIEGPADKIRALWEQVEAGDDESGLLDAMHPMPKELLEATAPSEDGEDWYSWRVANWSTKWEVSSEGLEFSDHGDGRASIEGWFDSAWAPPTGAYENFLEQNPDCSVSASYYEPGMDFAGFWKDGADEYCDNLHAEYEQPEENRSDLFKRLDEEYDLSAQFEEWDELDEEYEDE